MSAYLLTWNPSEHFPWDDLEEYIEAVKGGSDSVHSWSCGVTKSIVEGDRVFLMRVGDEYSGIVASGRVEPHDPSRGPAVRAGSDVYVDEHWEDPEKTALYVNVRFDTLLSRDRSLPLARLEEINENLPPGVKKQKWTPQNSGIRIREEVAPMLEAEWRRFLASGETVDEDYQELDRRGREHSRLLKRKGGGGEGMPHLQLKRYVASKPQAIGLPAGMLGREEYLFISGDECDVTFDLNEGESVVVEIKDGRERGELVKGIYQAVKYRALMAAEKGRGDEYPVRAYLVAYSIPADVTHYAARFGIECKALDRSLIQNSA